MLLVCAMTCNVMLVSWEKVLCIPYCRIFSQASQKQLQSNEQRVTLLHYSILLCRGVLDSVIKKKEEPVAKISTRSNGSNVEMGGWEGVCGDERERGEGAREGEGDEIKTRVVSTKTVSSCDSPQLSGNVKEETQMEALIWISDY